MQNLIQVSWFVFMVQTKLSEELTGMQIFAPMQHTRVSEGRCGKVLREDIEFIGGGGRVL